MPNNRRTLTAVLSLALGAAALAPLGVSLADSSVKAQMKARHDHFHQLGDAFKTVRDESRADEPDFAAIQKAAQVVNDASINQSRWFAPGTGPEAGKTRALPEIWTKPDDFAAAQKMFSDAAPGLLAAAKAKDVSALKAQFGKVGKACKNCHENFRGPEQE